MKIDLHCHTKKIKTGDPVTRNVTSEIFRQKLIEAGVKIASITNHNSFDINQFYEFQDTNYDLWPGVEFDIAGKASLGQIIVVCNPSHINVFDDVIKELIKGKRLENFRLEIDDFINSFKGIDIIIIAHFKDKEPALSMVDIDYLKNGFKGFIPIFMEPFNLRSAFIYMNSEDVYSLVGSDIRDWTKYPNKDLPELKMEIKDFQAFKKLIKKDPNVIQTYLDSKNKLNINVKVYDDYIVDIPIYDDINIFYGGKATAKSDTLLKLKEYFESIDPKKIAYYSAQYKSEDYNDLVKEKLEESDFQKFSISDSRDDIVALKKWSEPSLLSMKEYSLYIEDNHKNSIVHNFNIINAMFRDYIDENTYKTLYRDYKKITELSTTLSQYKHTDLLLEKEFFENFTKDGIKVVKAVYNYVFNNFANNYSNYLSKKTIQIIKGIYNIEKSRIPKPESMGLLSLYDSILDLKKVYNDIFAKLCLDNIIDNTTIIGKIDQNHQIMLKKEYSINPDKAPTKAKFLNSMKVTKSKDFKNKINKNLGMIYTSSNIKNLKELIDMANDYEIDSISKLISTKFTPVDINGQPKKASNGEQAMLILNNMLLEDKNVYILDEPEVSVGHKYINDVIIPRLRDLAKQRKKVIIATHDANIAVRTLPFTAVYREDLGDLKYKTFFGNPFTDDMINIADSSDVKSWAKTSMEVLEGGKDAFYERGETYGR